MHIDEEAFLQNVSQICDKFTSTIKENVDLINLKRGNADDALIEEDVEFDPDTHVEDLLL